MDRCSVRRTQQQTLDPQHLQRALELRHQRLHLRHIARLLAAHFSTVVRTLNHLGLGRLRNLEPKAPVQRYERETPGDLIHIDVKKLARLTRSDIASLAIGSRDDPRASAMTGSTWRSTMPHGWPTSRSSLTSSRARPSAS